MQPLDVSDTHDLVQVLLHPPESQQDAANAGCGPSRFFVGGGSSPGRAIRGDGAAGVASWRRCPRAVRRGGAPPLPRVPQRTEPERAASPLAGRAIPTSRAEPKVVTSVATGRPTRVGSCLVDRLAVPSRPSNPRWTRSSTSPKSEGQGLRSIAWIATSRSTTGTRSASTMEEFAPYRVASSRTRCDIEIGSAKRRQTSGPVPASVSGLGGARRGARALRRAIAATAHPFPA
jgi:hypothetical protein